MVARGGGGGASGSGKLKGVLTQKKRFSIFRVPLELGALTNLIGAFRSTLVIYT